MSSKNSFFSRQVSCAFFERIFLFKFFLLYISCIVLVAKLLQKKCIKLIKTFSGLVTVTFHESTAKFH